MYRHPLRAGRGTTALTAVALLALACLAGCGANERPGTADDAVAVESAAAFDTVSDFELVSVRGETVRLSDYRGKVVLLDFWATWCGPCRMEIPHFVELNSKYADRGFVIIGVAMDETGAEVVTPFVEKNKIPYPIVLGDAETAARFGGVNALPTTLLLGRDGQLVRKYIGYRDLKTFQDDIEPLL